ncbi:MAG: serine/threonine-protein phosphatase [Micromonosporaceae bacterium]|nr:serine/threonine-protein phosphatase [Micromonosporaceae bacterium]
MAVTLNAAMVTDLGLSRANNEDAGHAADRLIAVADGIGGMPYGEVASGVVIDSLAALDLTALEKVPPEQPPTDALILAIETANQTIGEMVRNDPGRVGMGTTVTALLLAGDEIGLVHVGDSRAYLLHDGELRQLTRDDTFVQGLVDEGVITAEEARRHPRRSLVTRAVQGQPLQPACALLPARPGDRYLLCSDGLSDVVEDGVIADVLRVYREVARCAQNLVDLALAAGAPDNVTVIVADTVET